MMVQLLRTRAPAKVNLCLHVLGRRLDGYHELESLVVFADIADALSLDLTRPLGLSVDGPTALDSGSTADNLVLRAARNLEALVPELKTGHFILGKVLPVAAGLGGGSSDAAAALRILAAANRIELHDERILEAARRTGADVPVCLACEARIMRGIGERLDAGIALEPVPALLVNPRVAVETSPVFRALGLQPGEASSAPSPDLGAIDWRNDMIAGLALTRNDLQAPAVSVAPIIAEALAALGGQDDVRLCRMSGSGATCFAVFGSVSAAQAAQRQLGAVFPTWWIEATHLGSQSVAVT